MKTVKTYEDYMNTAVPDKKTSDNEKQALEEYLKPKDNAEEDGKDEVKADKK